MTLTLINTEEHGFFAFDVGHSLFDIGYSRLFYPVILSKTGYFAAKYKKNHFFSKIIGNNFHRQTLCIVNGN